MKKMLILLFSLISVNTYSDVPLPAPKTWKVCDSTISFCASLNPKNNVTTIYKIDTNFESKEIYKIQDWSRSALISEDGDYFIFGYGGLNLVPKNVEKSQVMFTIYKSGSKHKEITLGEIIENFSHLEETVSHSNWGGVDSFYGNTLRLKTVEGFVSINTETGVVKRYKK
jgi:hypothetical protein